MRKIKIKLPVEVGYKEVLVDCVFDYYRGNLHIPVHQLDEFPEGPSFELVSATVAGEDAPKWLYEAISADIDNDGPFRDDLNNELFEDAI